MSYKAEEIKRFSVVPDGDIELWTVSGKLEDGFNWVIPLKFRPYLKTSENGELPLRYYFKPVEHWSNAIQYAVLCEVLDRFDHSPHDERGWWFSHETMSRFAQKAPGITPEFYERWPSRKLIEDADELRLLADNPELSDPDLKSRYTEFSTNELKFLKYLQSITGETSWTGMKILWLAMRQAAKRWLIEERKTLDLGFIRLIPIPYRVNWKEALAVRFAPFLSKFRKRWHRTDIVDDPKMDRSDLSDPSDPAAPFYAALSSVKLLAWDKHHHFAHWHIEALMHTEFERALKEDEYARFQKLGHAGYARHLLGQLARRVAELTGLFWRYVDKVLLPPARLIDGDQDTVRLVPDTKPGSVHPAKGLTKRLDLVPVKAFERWRSDDLTDQVGRTAPQFLPKPPEFLQDVPVMQETPAVGTAAMSNGSAAKLAEFLAWKALQRARESEESQRSWPPPRNA